MFRFIMGNHRNFTSKFLDFLSANMMIALLFIISVVTAQLTSASTSLLENSTSLSNSLVPSSINSSTNIFNSQSVSQIKSALFSEQISSSSSYSYQSATRTKNTQHLVQSSNVYSAASENSKRTLLTDSLAASASRLETTSKIYASSTSQTLIQSSYNHHSSVVLPSHFGSSANVYYTSALSSSTIGLKSLQQSTFRTLNTEVIQSSKSTSNKQLLSSTSTNEVDRQQFVYSSVYPCWVTYYVDASAVYPNQSMALQTEISSTPSKSLLQTYETKVSLSKTESQFPTSQATASQSSAAVSSDVQTSKTSSVIGTPVLSASSFLEASSTLVSTPRKTAELSRESIVLSTSAPSPEYSTSRPLPTRMTHPQSSLSMSSVKESFSSVPSSIAISSVGNIAPSKSSVLQPSASEYTSSVLSRSPSSESGSVALVSNRTSSQDVRPLKTTTAVNYTKLVTVKSSGMHSVINTVTSNETISRSPYGFSQSTRQLSAEVSSTLGLTTEKPTSIVGITRHPTPSIVSTTTVSITDYSKQISSISSSPATKILLVSSVSPSIDIQRNASSSFESSHASQQGTISTGNPGYTTSILPTSSLPSQRFVSPTGSQSLYKRFNSTTSIEPSKASANISAVRSTAKIIEALNTSHLISPSSEPAVKGNSTNMYILAPSSSASSSEQTSTLMVLPKSTGHGIQATVNPTSLLNYSTKPSKTSQGISTYNTLLAVSSNTTQQVASTVLMSQERSSTFNATVVKSYSMPSPITSDSYKAPSSTSNVFQMLPTSAALQNTSTVLTPTKSSLITTNASRVASDSIYRALNSTSKVFTTIARSDILQNVSTVVSSATLPSVVTLSSAEPALGSTQSKSASASSALLNASSSIIDVPQRASTTSINQNTSAVEQKIVVMSSSPIVQSSLQTSSNTTLAPTPSSMYDTKRSTYNVLQSLPSSVTLQTAFVVETSAATSSAVTSSAVTSPAATSSVATSSSAMSPAATSSAATSSAASSSATTSSAAASSTAATSSAATSLAATSSVATSSAATSPATTSSAATSSVATSSSATSTAATSSAATSTSATSPAATSPVATSLAATSSAATSPATTSSAATSPVATSLAATSSAATSSAAISSDTTSSAITSSAATSSAATSSAAISSDTTSSAATSSAATSSAATSSATTSSDTTSTAATSSAATSSAVSLVNISVLVQLAETPGIVYIPGAESQRTPQSSASASTSSLQSASISVARTVNIYGSTLARDAVTSMHSSSSQTASSTEQGIRMQQSSSNLQASPVINKRKRRAINENDANATASVTQHHSLYTFASQKGSTASASQLNSISESINSLIGNVEVLQTPTASVIQQSGLSSSVNATKDINVQPFFTSSAIKQSTSPSTSKITLNESTANSASHSLTPTGSMSYQNTSQTAVQYKPMSSSIVISNTLSTQTLGSNQTAPLPPTNSLFLSTTSSGITPALTTMSNTLTSDTLSVNANQSKAVYLQSTISYLSSNSTVSISHSNIYSSRSENTISKTSLNATKVEISTFSYMSAARSTMYGQQSLQTSALNATQAFSSLEKLTTSQRYQSQLESSKGSSIMATSTSVKQFSPYSTSDANMVATPTTARAAVSTVNVTSFVISQTMSSASISKEKANTSQTSSVRISYSPVSSLGILISPSQTQTTPAVQSTVQTTGNVLTVTTTSLQDQSQLFSTSSRISPTSSIFSRNASLMEAAITTQTLPAKSQSPYVAFSSKQNLPSSLSTQGSLPTPVLTTQVVPTGSYKIQSSSVDAVASSVTQNRSANVTSTARDAFSYAVSNLGNTSAVHVTYTHVVSSEATRITISESAAISRRKQSVTAAYNASASLQNVISSSGRFTQPRPSIAIESSSQVPQTVQSNSTYAAVFSSKRAASSTTSTYVPRQNQTSIPESSIGISSSLQTESQHTRTSVSSVSVKATESSYLQSMPLSLASASTPASSYVPRQSAYASERLSAEHLVSTDLGTMSSKIFRSSVYVTKGVSGLVSMAPSSTNILPTQTIQSVLTKLSTSSSSMASEITSLSQIVPQSTSDSNSQILVSASTKAFSGLSYNSETVATLSQQSIVMASSSKAAVSTFSRHQQIMSKASSSILESATSTLTYARMSASQLRSIAPSPAPSSSNIQPTQTIQSVLTKLSSSSSSVANEITSSSQVVPQSTLDNSSQVLMSASTKASSGLNYNSETVATISQQSIVMASSTKAALSTISTHQQMISKASSSILGSATSILTYARISASQLRSIAPSPAPSSSNVQPTQTIQSVLTKLSSSSSSMASVVTSSSHVVPRSTLDSNSQIPISASTKTSSGLSYNSEIVATISQQSIVMTSPTKAAFSTFSTHQQIMPKASSSILGSATSTLTYARMSASQLRSIAPSTPLLTTTRILTSSLGQCIRYYTPRVASSPVSHLRSSQTDSSVTRHQQTTSATVIQLSSVAYNYSSSAVASVSSLISRNTSVGVMSSTTSSLTASALQSSEVMGSTRSIISASEHLSTSIPPTSSTSGLQSLSRLPGNESISASSIISISPSQLSSALAINSTDVLSKNASTMNIPSYFSSSLVTSRPAEAMTPSVMSRVTVESSSALETSGIQRPTATSSQSFVTASTRVAYSSTKTTAALPSLVSLVSVSSFTLNSETGSSLSPGRSSQTTIQIGSSQATSRLPSTTSSQPSSQATSKMPSSQAASQSASQTTSRLTSQATSELPSSQIAPSLRPTYSSTTKASSQPVSSTKSSMLTSSSQSSSSLSKTTTKTSITPSRTSTTASSSVSSSVAARDSRTSTLKTTVISSSSISSSLSSIYVRNSTAVPTIPPVITELMELIFNVPLSVDISTPSFLQQLETNLANTYNALKVNRRRREVTSGSTTVGVTSLKRTTGGQAVESLFYVKENSVQVQAQQAASVYNQLTTAALSNRLGSNITVTSSVVVYQGTSSVSPSTRVPTTSLRPSTAATPTSSAVPTTPSVLPPTNSQLLGMVLQDEATSNNISVGNNRALFETRMANYYRTNKQITGTVIFKIFFLKHESKNLVYLEFYVTVNNVRQNSSAVALFYQVNTTTGALSALLKMTVLAKPYSLDISTTTANINKVKMTIKAVLASDVITSPGLKAKLSLRLADLYREARDLSVKRKRRATGSISAIIVSVTASTTVAKQGELIFYIIDKGQISTGVSVATTLNKITHNRMSAVLGVEVISLPAAVELPPTPVQATSLDLWIIGAVLGGCMLILIVAACILWRWKSGAPKGKVGVEEIELPQKNAYSKTGTPYGGYGDISRFAQGKTTGGPTMKTTSFSAPAESDEKQDVNLTRSMRRKVKPRDNYRPAPASKPAPGRQNQAYEESEEEDEDEYEESEYESDVPVPKKPETARPVSAQRPTSARRPVSAQRQVRVQPGPSRDYKTAESVQRSAVDSASEETEDEHVPQSQKPAPKPAAAELPPMGQMKDIQEAPSYPPVRFRTRIDSNANVAGHLPPLSKSGISLTARRLPEIDPELQQKADLERSRNKQRQRLRASGRMTSRSQNEKESSKFEKKAWKRAQSDISAVLDPMASSSSKRSRRRRRFRKSHKVDIAGRAGVADDDNKNVKLNNYMRLDSPNQSMSFDKTDDTKSEDAPDVSITEARTRMHTLLDDAFSLLEPFQKKLGQTNEPVIEERLLEGKETSMNQAPSPLENSLQYRGQVPFALPPPPHGRATAPPQGDRKRVFNRPIAEQEFGAPDGGYTMPPVLTREPMVVMDRSDRNRYLSQRLGQPVYATPQSTISYNYDQPPSRQNVFITPVQQQPDSMGGVIWSPYVADAVREDLNSSTAPLFNTMESPEREKRNLKSTLNSTPQRPQPNYTSIDMRNTPYDSPGMRETPQPLIRAIKEELLRLSQTARGRTQIQEL